MKITILLDENIKKTWCSEFELPEGMDKETFMEKLNNEDRDCLNLFWENANMEKEDVIVVFPYKAV